MKRSLISISLVLTSLILLQSISIIISNENSNVIGSKYLNNKERSLSLKVMKTNNSNDSLISKNRINKDDTDTNTNSNNNSNNNKENTITNVSKKIKTPINKTIINSQNSNSINDKDTKATNNKNNDINSSSSSSSNQQLQRTKTSYGDFFGNTSKNNENLAWKALSYFLLGIAAFIGSIHLTCWNERRSVKEAELTDYVSKESLCEVITQGSKIDKQNFNPNKNYLISGKLSVEKFAEIPDLKLDLNQRNILIRINIEKHYVHRSNEGVTTGWTACMEGEEKSTSKLYYATASINETYSVDIKKLSYLLNSYEKKGMNGGKYIHRFKNDELDSLKSYFPSAKDVSIDIDSEYCYYKFQGTTLSENDIRMSVIAVSV